MKKYNYTVFIGRFQPFHVGHYHIVEKALEHSETLIMVIGSAGAPRNTRNILTAEERVEVIKKGLTEEQKSRVKFAFVPDYLYNDDQWIASIQQAVFSTIHSGKFIAGSYTTALIGMSKDETSYYLNIFPQWKSIAVKPLVVVSATDIRNAFMRGDYDVIHDNMPEESAHQYIKYMEDIKEQLISDWQYEQDYGKKWGYGNHFTADACVVQSGHVLLIQRGKEYGHGLWALPGGFINPRETTFNASVRELYEETKIKVPEKVLRGSVVKSHLFDEPYRSNRGRIITNAYYYRLSDYSELPKVKGSDDAMNADWIPLAKVKNMRGQMFEDHYDIIQTLIGF